MAELTDSRLQGMLRRVMRETANLYHQSARWMVRWHFGLLESSPGGAAGFIELMDDLHRGLLVKVYVETVRADERWTTPEKLVAATMIEYLWGQELSGTDLKDAATELFRQADCLTWESLVAPFAKYPPLADSKVQVETVVMRMANLVAKCDGQTMPAEAAALHSLQRDLNLALHPLEKAASKPQSSASTDSRTAGRSGSVSHAPSASINQAEDLAGKLSATMKQLDELVGLDSVKQRVKSYSNFLKLQQQRRGAGLSTMPISLHMSFVGNPGTGKTTVARIVGQILGAMGTLSSGHVIETDRAGLVAQYAGQTAVKTNALCDSAIGGVLFIDEAYSLVDASGDDAYGREALQTLLKRMEDDRDRLAVILAGYSDEMSAMIRSNPGLSSRINTTIEFQDYSPSELGRIFGTLCDRNQYRLPSPARHRLLVGFHELHRHRDRHFGNGRLVRNAFEATVGAMADRIAEVAQMSESLLTTFVVDDIRLPGIVSGQWMELMQRPHRFRMRCGACGEVIRIPEKSLGQKVRCPKCQSALQADWPSIESMDASSRKA